MKRHPATRHAVHGLLCVALSGILALPLPALPATVSLASVPLTNGTTTKVLPNLMFIIDGSGSMASNYLPDWVNSNLCKKDASGNYSRACPDEPPFRSPDFNGIYYNPDIRYMAPPTFDGKSMPDMTSWSAVQDDAYNIQSKNKTNLTNDYVDVEWCTGTKDSKGNYNDCLRNDNYILPGVVGGKTYNIRNVTTAKGSGSVATGAPDTPGTATRSWGPHYYRIIPGEYCDSQKLKNCQTTQDSTYKYPAKLRWCNSEANATASTPAAGGCQGVRAGAFTHARYPTKFYSPSKTGQLATNALPASATFTVKTGCTTGKKDDMTVSVGIVNVDGANILSSATSNTNNDNSLASDIAQKINGGTSGFTATANKNSITIQAPLEKGDLKSSVSLGGYKYSGTTGSCSVSISPVGPTFSGYVPAKPAVPDTPASYPGSFQRVDIVSGSTYPRSAARTDCTTSATSCTYTEEMTNFANWWTYYRTRMQAMKSAASIAFKPIDSAYRVGFIDLWGGNYLPIARFDAGTGNAKDLWYKKLVSMNPANNTPLRSALARVGQIFAGKKPVGSSDPIEYSCQQNFALLTTDGYWNNDSGTNVKGVDGTTEVGNMDADPKTRPKYEGPTPTYNTLADVAKYYFDTDLRDKDKWNNCKGALNGADVCENNVFTSNTDNYKHQHMTTFTLGLGVDGTLFYTSDYKTAAEGDYYDIVHGGGSPPLNWPVPVADNETAVDDLWHAAVNGGGTYFSAKDPAQLASGLSQALAAIDAKLGAGSAAATSTLNPIAGDNFAYIASYTTMKWLGNLESREIDPKTGVIKRTANSWCVENVPAAPCNGTVIAETAGGVTTNYCTIPNSTVDTCSGTLDGTTCKISMTLACSGTMAEKIDSTSDSRTIFMSDSKKLVDFKYGNMTATQQAYFSGTGLSQWAVLDEAQKAAAAGANMVNYLRGQTGFEDRSSNPVANRLYRYREATLGDVLESQPAYVGKPYFNYTDPGYAEFVEAQKDRAKTVYIGANDGMLHAFDASTKDSGGGVERWAFVPSMVLSNMWKLADKNYASMHTNFVNGKPVIADICPSAPRATCTKDEWRTILVAGLNGGGRGYYALDITNPTAPKFLWEIDSNTDTDIGYSFGPPVVTKKADGTWVVLLTSGYNNVDMGNGQGYLYVRNAYTGEAIAKIGTGAGDTTTPSGLAKIGNWGDDPNRNNTSVYAYGGDLLGNLWRFDINAEKVMKFAVLTDADGNTQPITTRPELGLINGKRVVFVATGKYLEISDLTDTRTQSLYAIKDDNPAMTLTNLRLSLKKQTITSVGMTASRTASGDAVDFDIDLGWYVDFPDSGERNHVDPKLDSGMLIVPTTVPSNTACAPGGYGWLNYFDYRTGNYGKYTVSQRFNGAIVGINVFYTTDGKRHVTAVQYDKPEPEEPKDPLPDPDGPSGFAGKRVIWRELIP